MSTTKIVKFNCVIESAYGGIFISTQPLLNLGTTICYSQSLQFFYTVDSPVEFNTFITYGFAMDLNRQLPNMILPLLKVDNAYRSKIS